MAAAWSWSGWFPDAPARRGHSLDGPCEDCGLPHTPERRLAILRRCDGMTPTEIVEAYPHIWPALGPGGRWMRALTYDKGSSGHRLLMRDLAALRRERGAP